MLPTLTPKQERFIAEYLIDLNATQAAIRAGYSERTANKTGPRLLVNVGIQKAIEAAKAKLSKRIEITQEYIADNLAEIVERCMQRAPVLEFDRVNKCYVQAKDEDGNNLWTFNANGATNALTLLSRRTGGFADRQIIEHIISREEAAAELYSILSGQPIQPQITS